jgi:glycerate kinase
MELDQRLAFADLVITGEGSLGSQTIEGKLVAIVARRAREHELPVVGVVGRLACGAEVVQKLGLSQVLVAGTAAGLTAAGREIATTW